MSGGSSVEAGVRERVCVQKCWCGKESVCKMTFLCEACLYVCACLYIKMSVSILLPVSPSFHLSFLSSNFFICTYFSQHVCTMSPHFTYHPIFLSVCFMLLDLHTYPLVNMYIAMENYHL